MTGGGPDGAKDFSRTSGISGQEACGNHTVPGMEHIGTGYSGPHTKRGDISAPTGSLPAGLPVPLGPACAPPTPNPTQGAPPLLQVSGQQHAGRKAWLSYNDTVGKEALFRTTL